MRKLLILLNSFRGYLRKWMIDIGYCDIPSLNANCTTNLVVSLTSYGRRVSNNIVYYTIVSILRQKVQPSRIILWLAENEWNDSTLPLKIKALRNKGVEIRYCEDLRSYKKLIPTLKLCPNDCIITVDDDVIYSEDLLQRMSEVHDVYQNDIITFNSAIPGLTDGVPQKYEKWTRYIKEESGLLIFPVGVGGVLYPPNSLHKDVLNKDLFNKLCPYADDIWFWFCGLRKHTNKRNITKRGVDTSFDSIYQKFHQGSALTHSNRMQYQNDKQFKNLFDYYNVKINEKGELC